MLVPSIITATGMGASSLGRAKPCQDSPRHLSSLRSSPQSTRQITIIITSPGITPVASFRLAREQTGKQAVMPGGDIPPLEVLEGNQTPG